MIASKLFQVATRSNMRYIGKNSPKVVYSYGRYKYFTTNKDNTTPTEPVEPIESIQDEEQPATHESENDPLKALQDHTAKLENDIKEMRDKVMRSYAEEENVRRIAKMDVEKAKKYANSKFAKAILDVADNMDRALDNTKTEVDKIDGDKSVVQNLLVGLEMTSNELTKVFGQHGIVKYGAVGDTFNPDLHDALFNMPDPTKEKAEGSIGQVVKSGYMLHDRVLRAAEVGTITHP